MKLFSRKRPSAQTSKNHQVVTVAARQPEGTYLLLPEVGSELIMVVDQELIDQIRDWGGAENLAWADKMERFHKLHGDYGYPMIFVGADSMESPLMGQHKDSQGQLRFALPEHNDPTLDVNDPLSETPNERIPMNSSYFVDNFPRLTAEQVDVAEQSSPSTNDTVFRIKDMPTQVYRRIPMKATPTGTRSLADTMSSRR